MPRNLNPKYWPLKAIFFASFLLGVLFYGVLIPFSIGQEDPSNAPFDGEKFDNIEPFPDKSFFQLLKWRVRGSSNSVPWPEKVEAQTYKPEYDRSGDVKVTVVNHASVLIQMDSINILTDPIFSDRASPVSFAGPKRVRPPAIAFKDLPPVDVVVISHNHYDHLDLDSLKQLEKKYKPLFLVGLKNKDLLESEDIDPKRIVEMDWWQTHTYKNLKIHFVPAQHWSARGLFDKRETLWGGFYIEGSHRVYFAGDTGWGKFFRLIQANLGSPDISLLPIGAYEPRWFMKPAHMNPQEAVQAAVVLGSKFNIGIHFGTFKLTDEGIDRPKRDLEKALKDEGFDKEAFIYPEFGKAYGL